MVVSPYFETSLGKLYCGDAGIILSDIDNASIDLIITDPPYPKEFEYLYEILFSNSARILKSRGNLISLCGHYQLPYVLDVGRKYLRFWWIFWMVQSRLNRLIGKGVAVKGKPAVWFLKERRRPYPEYRMPIDTLESKLSEDKEAKLFHKWGQSGNWFAHYILELTHENELVLDPFLGSGTVALVCENLNRRWIGIEIDLNNCEIIKNRLLSIEN